MDSDAARKSYFSERTDLDQVRVVDQLCDYVNRLIRTDLGLAERLVETADWLAKATGSANAKGRQLRAAGNIYFGRRDYPGAIEQYEAALGFLEKADNKRELVRTLSSGLGFLSHLGQHEKGEAWAGRARELCASLDEPLLKARLEFNEGHALAQQDRYGEALERYQAAYESFKEGGEPTDVAVALRNIAVTHQQLDDFSAALNAYREAAEYCREKGLSRLLLEVEYNQAYLYFLRGDSERSIRLFDEARVRCEEVEDWHHKALCDLDQSEIFLELNLIEEAGTMGARAFEQFEELAMPHEAAQALTLQGIAANRANSRDDALELLEKARDRFAKQNNPFRLGEVDIFRAQVLYEQGKHRSASELVTSAHETFKQIGLPTKIALCELLLARLALSREDAQAARAWAESTLALLEDIGAPALEYQAHLMQGLAVESTGDRESALASYRKAFDTLERLRGNLQADELKIAFSTDQQAVYECLISLLLEEVSESEEAVFDLIQKAKSRSLSDLLATRLHELGPARAQDQALVSEIQELRGESSWVHRQIDLEQSKADKRSSQRLDSLRETSRGTEQRLLRKLRQLQMADPDLGALQGSSSADLDGLRAQLPPGTQMLEYFIARGAIHVCLIDSARLVIRPLAEESLSQKDFLHLRTQLGKLASGYEPTPQLREFNEQATTTLLERLHDALIAPLRAQLDGRHLIVAPHGFLHSLPFHALRQGERALIDDFSLSYAPSGTVFQLCSVRKSERGQGALVLGIPDEKAPLIEEEVRTVAEILPQSKLLLNEEASHENLAVHGADCRLLHIATHGLFRRDNPMFSAIRLGTSRLSVFDLYKLKLKADLVVLSGCSTGLSSVQGSDELVGLTRGLLYAGARSVLVSLWDVNDDSTNRFMALFYGHLTSSVSPATALRRAQQELREQHSHPYHWAPFVLVGRVETPEKPN